MKPIKQLAAVAAVAVLLACAGPAAAETGTQNFRIVFAGPFSAAAAGGTTGRTVVTTGVVNSVGYEEDVSQGPGATPGTFVGSSDFLFPVGRYSVEVTGRVDSLTTFGPNGCHTAIEVSGTYEITGGSGAFAGASGRGTFTGRNLVLGTPTRDGCSLAEPMLVSRIQASGSLTLAGAQAA